MSDRPIQERLHLPALSFALAFVALAVAVPLVTGEPVTPLYATFGALGTGFLVATALDAVRSHELYELGRTVAFTVFVGLWWLIYGGFDGPVTLFLAIGVVSVLLELYNDVSDASAPEIGC